MVFIIVYHLPDNRKINFLILGGDLLLTLTALSALSEKKISINFTKAKTKYCLILHCNGGNNYLFVNEKEIYNLKANNKMLTFLLNFF